MNDRDLHRRLVDAADAERQKLISEIPGKSFRQISESLRDLCYETWTADPQRVAAIVRVLDEIRVASGDPIVGANADWTRSIDHLINGRLEESLQAVGASESVFIANGLPVAAANTQISKVYTLALLGRYDEAIECGLRARRVFESEGDDLAAGKAEHNIGNLYLRRDRYAEAEHYLRLAHDRFLKLNDHRQTAMLENNIAFAMAAQNRFRDAEKVYRSGLKRSREHGLKAIEADIETSMSSLYLFQGRFDDSLRFLERARDAYEKLGMPQHCATSNLELADIYLELNLLPEAARLYAAACAVFENFGMRAELARGRLNLAKARFLMNDPIAASEDLQIAEALFTAEGNRVAVADAKLVRARHELACAEIGPALANARNARRILAKEGSVRRRLFADWLLGEIRRRSGDRDTAMRLLRRTRAEASGQSPHIEFICLVSLGEATGDDSFFEDAVAIAERSRLELGSEDFRAAFLGDKLAPYHRLMESAIRRRQVREALVWHERARSRTLAEQVSSRRTKRESAGLSRVRDELNWFYSRLGKENRGIADVRANIERLEIEIAERSRRNRKKIRSKFGTGFDAEDLRRALRDRTLLEYCTVGENFSAFVVSADSERFYLDLGPVDEIARLVRRLNFQIMTARFGDGLSPRNQVIAANRFERQSMELYQRLIEPLEPSIASAKLAIVPSGTLHYLPFHALWDGRQFLGERLEISYAPSAAILSRCVSNGERRSRSALFVGASDSIAPAIRAEVAALAGSFEEAVTLVDRDATVRNLARSCRAADIVHLACHGIFRPDNPSFSALELDRERLTMRDAAGLDLDGKLVVLSACETGAANIESGEEMIGLARGFFAAGAASLVVSAWPVDDVTTLRTMARFYGEMRAGENPAAALRSAQAMIRSERPEPYFWAPFSVFGRW